MDETSRARHGMTVSARAALRSATAINHDAVDTLFGRFDLSDRISYGRFLTAHARVLPAVENALSACGTLSAFTPRTGLLAADLAALGLLLPDLLSLALPEGEAAAFGALYVIEGSRLGGALLAKRLSDGFPRAYLSAAHPPGAWRAFGEVLDGAEKAGGPGWLERATAAAQATFDLYAQAAKEA